MDKLIIAGIDPGTTGAYALLDLEGNLIKIDSGRGFSQSQITLGMVGYGKIFAIGCDVCQRPALTAKVASSIGAKIISPDHDLKYSEKIKILDNFLKKRKEFIKIENKHEKDALAAALYGLKRINGIIKKINDHLAQNNKKHLSEKVIRKVLIESMPIVDAVKSFE